jgi:general secretion pathway protein M
VSLAEGTMFARPVLSRIAALTILGVLVVGFCAGPLAFYVSLVGDNGDALAAKAALLQRYRALGSNTASFAPPASPALLYPDMPESQASALLQETVKSIAAAAHVQVQGLQVLRGDTLPGATRIGVRVRSAGDMASLRSLIYAIETARPMLYPDNLQIQAHAAASDTAPAMLDFQLDISGFRADPAP